MMRGGPARPFSEILPSDPDARAAAVLALARARPGLPPPADEVPPQPAPEPAANSPEDLGYARPEPAAAPRHEPKRCGSCGAEILWIQLLDDKGQRRRRDDGRLASMPVDFAPTPDGNVQVFHRPGEGIVARVYRDAAHAPAGAILRKSHFATCVNAAQHRRKP